MPRSRSFLAALSSAFTAILLMLGLTLGAAPAMAHAGLTSSNPEDGATLDALPDEVVLEFTEEISAPAYVVVTDSNGGALQSGETVIDGATVRQRIDPAARSGLHTIAYRVISTDGHPVQGHVRVTVNLEESDPAPSSPTDSAATTDPADDSAAEDTSPLFPTPLLIAGGVVAALVVLLLLGVLALTKRGRR